MWNDAKYPLDKHKLSTMVHFMLFDTHEHFKPTLRGRVAVGHNNTLG
jgi:hypothetical protein